MICSYFFSERKPEIVSERTREYEMKGNERVRFRQQRTRIHMIYTRSMHTHPHAHISYSVHADRAHHYDTYVHTYMSIQYHATACIVYTHSIIHACIHSVPCAIII